MNLDIQYLILQFNVNISRFHELYLDIDHNITELSNKFYEFELIFGEYLDN